MHIFSQIIIGSVYHKSNVYFIVKTSQNVISFLSELNTYIGCLTIDYEKIILVSHAMYHCTIHCDDN